VAFIDMAASIEYIRAGRLRALAVTTAARSEALPDVPTIADLVPGFEASQWVGLGAPTNTPSEIIGKLNSAINAALAVPTLKARFADLGGTVLPGSAADFHRRRHREVGESDQVLRRQGRVIADKSIRPPPMAAVGTSIPGLGGRAIDRTTRRNRDDSRR
jgi:tripartite-type tricarboxylate transporter receptor subunit TctC